MSGRSSRRGALSWGAAIALMVLQGVALAQPPPLPPPPPPPAEGQPPPPPPQEVQPVQPLVPQGPAPTRATFISTSSEQWDVVVDVDWSGDVDDQASRLLAAATS